MRCFSAVAELLVPATDYAELRYGAVHDVLDYCLYSA